jgi:hypothetical protein
VDLEVFGVYLTYRLEIEFVNPKTSGEDSNKVNTANSSELRRIVCLFMVDLGWQRAGTAAIEAIILSKSPKIFLDPTPVELPAPTRQVLYP